MMGKIELEQSGTRQSQFWKKKVTINFILPLLASNSQARFQPSIARLNIHMLLQINTLSCFLNQTCVILYPDIQLFN